VELLSKNQNNLGSVRYTAERQLRCVSYTAEYLFHSVRYTAEAIAKQMKATTALKRTILPKIDQNLKFLSYSMMTMNLNKCAPFNRLGGICILHRGNDFIFEYLHKFLAKNKIIPEYFIWDQEK